jgi:hypothetical protein
MPQVCFILGIMPRCGTNFCENQIRLHPKCAAPGPVWEDFLVASLPGLKKWESSFKKRWDTYWFRNTKVDYFELLDKQIGIGLQNFLLEQLDVDKDHEYILSKTPTVKGLENFQDYFPNSKLIIIIRDGRSAVESGQRSFNWDFEKSCFDWAKNAKKIIRHQEKFSNSGLLTKFEDLCLEPEKSMHTILSYLGLNSGEVNKERLIDSEVSGSSDIKSDSGELHWKPVKKDKNFNPTQRHINWPIWKEKIFFFIAGKQMENLGYDHIKINRIDYIWISLFLLSWPLRVISKTLYFIVKRKIFILKTN